MTQVHEDHRPRKFWALLCPDGQRVLREVGRIVRYSAGEVIFTEGDESKFALVIESGAIKVTRRGSDGEELLAVRAVGDLIGEAVWSEDERNATVTALCEVQALRFDAEDFERLTSRGDVAQAILRVLRDRHTEFERRAVAARKVGSARRLARLLIELADEFGRRAGEGCVVDLGLSQKQLGQLILASERAVNGIFEKWRKNGLVSTRHCAFVVHDDVGLRKAAGW